MMQQTAELELRVPLCCFSYPGQAARRCFRSLCTGHGRLSSVPLCRRTSLHELRRCLVFLRLCTIVRSLHRYYSSVRLPIQVHVELLAPGLPQPDRPWMVIGRSWDIPVSVQRVCMHALVLRLRGSVSPLAIAQRTILPSPSSHKVGTRIGDFGAQLPCLHAPCQRFAAPLARGRRMTRGHGWSLPITEWETFTPCPPPAFTGAFDLHLQVTV